MKINGYLIVIKKNLAYTYFAKDNKSKKLLVNNTYYAGIGRMWDFYFPQKIPDNLSTIVEDAELFFSRTLRFKMFNNFCDATKVLNYIKNSQHDYDYEIIGIYSKDLNEITEEIEDDNVKFLGFDIDCNGLFIIKEELFASNICETMPNKFVQFSEKLNEHGLFSSHDEAKLFFQVYKENQKLYELEGLNGATPDYISIGARENPQPALAQRNTPNVNQD